MTFKHFFNTVEGKCMPFKNASRGERGFFFPIFIVFIKKNIFEKKMIVLIILDLIDFFFQNL